MQKEWPSSLRMSLWPVERVIDARDKKRARHERRQAAAAAGGKQTVNGAIHSDADGDERDVLEESADGLRVDEKADKSSGNEKEEGCAWEDELRALVKGGVPMYLRGEVWRCFIMGLSVLLRAFTVCVGLQVIDASA